MGPSSSSSSHVNGFFFFFFFFFLCFFLTMTTMEAAIAKTNVTTLISSTCEKTEYKDLCVETLTSSGKAANADIKGLAAIAIEVASKKAKRTAGHIANLLESTNPPTLQQCIADCSEYYEDVVDQLNDAKKDLEDLPEGGQNAQDEVFMWLSAAIGDSEACESGCNLQDVQKDVLTERNTETKALCGIAVSIVNLVLSS